ncbi:G protein pathway suppressor 2-like isoform X1 [Paramormyrops kingsleyae]|uniref:G protein pathway suppressor 2-like isoform X1 n=2 Tax=Paramormyrops kingsleyae TaxID=1676925 RepID=UPI003B977A9E
MMVKATSRRVKVLLSKTTMPIFRRRKLFYFPSPILYVNGSATSRILRHCWLLAPPPPITMPALLERPKLSNAMARALHKHIMRERERRRQEEEEVDKMMEQKMKEEEERKRKKEMEERMSLEETKEQIMKMGGKLQGLQEEKHQLFLQLKKVLHEEEKRRRKEQSDMPTLTSASYQTSMPIHSGQHLLSMQGSPVSHGRTGALLGDRSKQLFQTPVIPVRHFQGQPAFSTGSSEHGQYSASQSAHGPYGVSQQQHASPYAATQSVPVSFASSSQLRAAPAFPTMQYLPHQQQGYPVHSHFTSQTGFIPSASIPLQKQLEHANQQSGFTDSGTLRPLPTQALHTGPAGLLAPASLAVQIPPSKSGLPYGHPPQPASPGGFSHGTSPQQAHATTFQSSPQPASRHAYLSHPQTAPRFYHHSK